MYLAIEVEKKSMLMGKLRLSPNAPPPLDFPDFSCGIVSGLSNRLDLLRFENFAHGLGCNSLQF